MKLSQSIRESPTIQETLSKDAPSVVSMSHGKSSSKTFRTSSNQHSTGSPVGSPLSPALCLMVVSNSEQIWSITFHQLLSNHHLFIRHIRYVNNRLIFGDKRLTDLAPYEVLLDDGFYGKPIILETEPDQEFLGFMLETKPVELIYQGPTNLSQVLSPFSASPPKVLLSGFRSRCHIVIKGAFPTIRVQQGLAQLIQLYTRAGFPNEELQTISETLLTQHQNLQPPCQICTAAAALLWLSLLLLLLFFLFLSFFLLSLLVVFLPCLCFCFFAASWLNFRLPPLSVPISIPMDHAQGRAFHHHLARAIMHLNHLAGLLPFFEPSSEWEDAMPPSHFHLERRRQEASTPSSLYHRHLPHRRWWHMEASHHSWSWILNRTCVLLQCIHYTTRKPIRLQAHLRPPVTHPSQRIQSRIPIRAPQQWQILLGHHQNHNPGSCSIQTMCVLSWRSTTEETTKGFVDPRHPCTGNRTMWPSWPSSHHLRSTTWWLRFWRLRWRCSIQSCLRPWSHGSWHELSHPTTHHHHIHHTSWLFHSHTDTESTCTTTCNLPHSPAKSTWCSSRSSISSMDQRWWSRANELKAGHEVPSFVEDDRGQITSWSPGVQTPLGHPKTNGPTWPCSSTSGTWGWGLKRTDLLEKVGRRCFHFHSLFLSFCPSPRVSLFLSLSCFPLVSFLSFVWLFLLRVLFTVCHFIASGNMAHSSAHIRAAPERSRSRDDPMHVAASSVAASQYISWLMAGRPFSSSSSKRACDRRLGRCTISHDQSPWWYHLGIHNMWRAATRLPALSQPQWRTGSVHIQCPAEHPKTWHIHGVQPSLHHQPTHLVYMGPLPSSFFNGRSLARRDWRHLRSPQWRPPGWTPSWTSSSLDWRPGMWHFIS